MTTLTADLKVGDIIKSKINASIFGYYIIDIIDDGVIWYRKIVDGRAVFPGYRVQEEILKPEYYELVYRAEE